MLQQESVGAENTHTARLGPNLEHYTKAANNESDLISESTRTFRHIYQCKLQRFHILIASSVVVRVSSRSRAPLHQAILLQPWLTTERLSSSTSIWSAHDIFWP